MNVFLSLGSNKGDRRASIREALNRIGMLLDTRVTDRSSLYESSPVNFEDQPYFLNIVCRIETGMDPFTLLGSVLNIENDMGRVRKKKWGPRNIDIDILLYGDVCVSTPVLTIPHPRMFERAFVIVPMMEIAPGLKFPDGRKPADVLREIGEEQRVVRLAETL